MASPQQPRRSLQYGQLLKSEVPARERRFVLDCIAVDSIARDYNCSLPKLGSIIPPYNGQKDKHTTAYFRSKPVPPLLSKTGQANGGTSIMGKLSDRFQYRGAAALYLSTRNNVGAGHSVEEVGGHSLFLTSLKPVPGYNGLHGYRRNTYSLRTCPSTFGLVTHLPLH
ncbi:uncharacterized protein C17orf98-like [Protopterus annectens]|uniref:uncharacterized protein C17orf98-like n=1 Tax=Protopterus annectens TaxID=7888 RepID=UPI001CF960A1|nr:uncharacterized protein C17orf98-like [Protopterus annectens]